MKNDKFININEMLEIVHKMCKVIEPYTYYGKGGILERSLTDNVQNKRLRGMEDESTTSNSTRVNNDTGGSSNSN